MYQHKFIWYCIFASFFLARIFAAPLLPPGKETNSEEANPQSSVNSSNTHDLPGSKNNFKNALARSAEEASGLLKLSTSPEEIRRRQSIENAGDQPGEPTSPTESGSPYWIRGNLPVTTAQLTSNSPVIAINADPEPTIKPAKEDVGSLAVPKEQKRQEVPPWHPGINPFEPSYRMDVACPPPFVIADYWKEKHPNVAQGTRERFSERLRKKCQENCLCLAPAGKVSFDPRPIGNRLGHLPVSERFYEKCDTPGDAVLCEEIGCLCELQVHLGLPISRAEGIRTVDSLPAIIKANYPGLSILHQDFGLITYSSVYRDWGYDPPEDKDRYIRYAPNTKEPYRLEGPGDGRTNYDYLRKLAVGGSIISGLGGWTLSKNLGAQGFGADGETTNRKKRSQGTEFHDAASAKQKLSPKKTQEASNFKQALDNNNKEDLNSRNMPPPGNLRKRSASDLLGGKNLIPQEGAPGVENTAYDTGYNTYSQLRKDISAGIAARPLPETWQSQDPHTKATDFSRLKSTCNERCKSIGNDQREIEIEGSSVGTQMLVGTPHRLADCRCYLKEALEPGDQGDSIEQPAMGLLAPPKLAPLQGLQSANNPSITDNKFPIDLTTEPDLGDHYRGNEMKATLKANHRRVPGAKEPYRVYRSEHEHPFASLGGLGGPLRKGSLRKRSIKDDSLRLGARVSSDDGADWGRYEIICGNFQQLRANVKAGLADQSLDDSWSRLAPYRSRSHFGDKIRECQRKCTCTVGPDGTASLACPPSRAGSVWLLQKVCDLANCLCYAAGKYPPQPEESLKLPPMDPSRETNQIPTIESLGNYKMWSLWGKFHNLPNEAGSGSNQNTQNAGGEEFNYPSYNSGRRLAPRTKEPYYLYGPSDDPSTSSYLQNVGVVGGAIGQDRGQSKNNLRKRARERGVSNLTPRSKRNTVSGSSNWYLDCNIHERFKVIPRLRRHEDGNIQTLLYYLDDSPASYEIFTKACIDFHICATTSFDETELEDACQEGSSKQYQNLRSLLLQNSINPGGSKCECRSTSEGLSEITDIISLSKCLSPPKRRLNICMRTKRSKDQMDAILSSRQSLDDKLKHGSLFQRSGRPFRYLLPETAIDKQPRCDPGNGYFIRHPNLQEQTGKVYRDKVSRCGARCTCEWQADGSYTFECKVGRNKLYLKMRGADDLGNMDLEHITTLSEFCPEICICERSIYQNDPTVGAASSPSNKHGDTVSRPKNMRIGDLLNPAGEDEQVRLPRNADGTYRRLVNGLKEPYYLEDPDPDTGSGDNSSLGAGLGPARYQGPKIHSADISRRDQSWELQGGYYEELYDNFINRATINRGYAADLLHASTIEDVDDQVEP
ncbi:hypothetical protein H072_6635 [Dactylellina haptotyla CBS 200.50]|uniref:Uncharacterized protein n=1 Tax=Dactylellina haptotyla (strain CBS 200.50) TaxID=1284197 RepID=S8A948_DACHA|nr:hypothetical protein H072_6635 [Dactylellina haptotyla CBS 200.50]